MCVFVIYLHVVWYMTHLTTRHCNAIASIVRTIWQVVCYKRERWIRTHAVWNAVCGWQAKKKCRFTCVCVSENSRVWHVRIVFLVLNILYDDAPDFLSLYAKIKCIISCHVSTNVYSLYMEMNLGIISLRVHARLLLFAYIIWQNNVSDGVTW